MIPPGKRHSVRLCATFVRTVNVPGRYGDGYGGHGLSLLVTPRKSGGLSKTWAQAISPNGTKTSLGLGSYPVVTLAMAREKALANARAIAEGRDPRRRMQRVPTFAQANETVSRSTPSSWKSDRVREEPVARQHARLRPAASARASASTPSPPPTSWRCCCPSGRGDAPAGADERRVGAALARRRYLRRRPRHGALRSSSWCSPPRARARCETPGGSRSTATGRCGRSRPSA